MKGQGLVEYILILLLFLALIFGLFWFLAQLEANSNYVGEFHTTKTGITYQEFTIDGMPCFYIEQGIGSNKTGGPTCDWSKHKE